MPYSGQVTEVQIPDGTIWEIPGGGGGGSVDPATATPLMDGTGAVGTSAKYAREDHVHPSDTSKQDTLVSGTNIKTINGVSVLGSGDIVTPDTTVDPATATPLMDGTAAVGTSAKYAREDHVHPTDTSRQETLVSGTNIKTINGESILGSGDITTPDRYIKHLLDSSNASGLRQISSTAEDSNYTVGDYATALGYNTKASGQASYAEGDSTRSLFNNTHTEGHNTEASRYNAHAEGGSTTASGDNSHAEGYQTTASGQQGHAEGNNTTASGNNSHAEGYLTTASNSEAHAEGTSTTASGSDAHAEGHSTTASGNSSHAQNYGTQAKAINSSAAGYYTVAGSENQFVVGKYNVEDANNDYGFIVGNGYAANNSNAFAVRWDGRAVLGADPTQNMDAVTKQYLDNAISGVSYTAGKQLTLTGSEFSLSQYPDTRSANENPEWYMTNYGRRTVTEFKYCSTIGISTTQMYCALRTYVPWGDSSGSYPVQFATVGNTLFMRTGTSNTAWGSWVNVTANTTYSAGTGISISGTTITATGVKDDNSTNTITFSYNKAGLTTTSWFAAWNGYELRAISPANALTTMIGAMGEKTGSVSAATNTYVTALNTGSLAAGTYLFTVSADMGGTGTRANRRMLMFTTASSSNTPVTGTSMWIGGNPNGATSITYSFLLVLSAATTYYLRCLQQTGDTQTISARVRWLKLR